MSRLIVLLLAIYLFGCESYRKNILYEKDIRNEFQEKWRVRYGQNNQGLLLFSDNFNEIPFRVEEIRRKEYTPVFDSTVAIPQKFYYGVAFDFKSDKLKIHVNKKTYKLNVKDTFRVIKLVSVQNDMLNVIYSNNFESGE